MPDASDELVIGDLPDHVLEQLQRSALRNGRSLEEEAIAVLRTALGDEEAKHGTPPLKLWGRLNSINVQKVVWCLEELGLPYERVDAGGPFGVVDTPEYRRLNPNGLVPVIEEDGFTLWESNAVVRYLAAKHDAGGLWPADLRIRADADRWMDWQTTAFGPAMGPAFHGLIRTAPEKRDAAAIAAAVAKAEPMAALLDAHLADRAYVAGDAFSMGDIAAGAAAHRWLNLPIAREPRPHLERWHRRLQERPAAAKVLVAPIT
jgi:glutathione S-transferase